MMQKRWMLCVAAVCAINFMLADRTNAQESDRTTVVTRESSDDWDISGPVFLRAATPEEEGSLAIKNIYRWSRQKDREDNPSEYELELEYGFAPDHAGILSVPFVLGEGRVDGNGDISVGWHWRLWEEMDCGNCGHHKPAFAMRNIFRVPTGVDSNGVDYTWRGLITWTVTPGKSRLHLNPFAKFVNGDNNDDDDFDMRDGFGLFRGDRDGDEENTQYGAAIGMDYRINDCTLFTWDYIWSSKQFEEGNDNHALELGIEWELADDQMLALATEWGIDGNHEGTEFGARIMYQIDITLN